VDGPGKGISHVQLRVTDVARSVEWYCKAVGLVRGSDEPIAGAMALFTPNRRAAVVISAGRDAGARTELDHVALGVADRETLVAWAEHLDAEGIERSELDDNPVGLSLYLYDPDGLQVELIAP
jgi:catechol 2,3-dioxygenase-like lactoylglutathione lyase family enzyme